jgi:hypothetical protein
MARKINEVRKIDPYGIPNVCFTNVDKADANLKLRDKWFRQRVKRGFDDTELWDLSITLLKFLQPRLRAWIKQGPLAVPGKYCKASESQKEFNKALKKWINVLKEIDWMITEEITNKEETKIFNKYTKRMYKSDFSDLFKSREDEKLYKKDLVKLIKRKEKARALLQEHLFDLWD